MLPIYLRYIDYLFIMQVGFDLLQNRKIQQFKLACQMTYNPALLMYISDYPF